MGPPEDARGGNIALHSLRVELIAKLSTIQVDRLNPPHGTTVRECVEAAKIVCEKGKPDVEPG